MDHKVAYYECLEDEETISLKNYWEIGYPLGFFVKICNELIQNTKKYLETNLINPYSLIPFFPCSYNCGKAIDYAEKNLSII